MTGFAWGFLTATIISLAVDGVLIYFWHRKRLPDKE